MFQDQESLNDVLLQAFITRFLGYGSLDARVWFIGMEEGGGNDFAQVSQRLETWRSRGMRELENVRDYHLAIGIERFFREPVKTQRTWAQLVRVYLSALGRPTELNDIKRFQACELGQPQGDTAILELMPLCSPATSHWFYGRWSELAYLQSRAEYLARVMPERIALLKKKLQANQPKAVIFYGASYREFYEQIIGARTHFNERLDCYSFDAQTTRYLVIKHPASKGITNEYFLAIGRYLREWIKERDSK